MSSARMALVVLLVVAVLGGLLWWRRERPTTAPVAATPSAPAPAPRPSPPPAPPAQAIRYPVPSVKPSPARLPSLEGADDYVKRELVDLLGRKAVLSFLHLDGFVRDFVATVNNLGTDNASAQVWPVKPTAGRIDVELREGDLVISPKNAERYAAFVHFADSIDTQRAVALYERLYPLFQAAYEDLGYPGKYFNDRVIDTIDDLLATPKMAGPIKLKQIKVDGAAPPSGGLYLFEDPTLEARSAGQKILLRMGSANALLLEAKLRDVRQRLVTRPPAHSTK